MPNIYFTPNQIPYQLRPFVINLTGQNFGLLTVLEPVGRYTAPGNPKNTSILWRCQCACGAISDVSSTNLRAKNGTKSCGCVTARTHGMTGTRIYNVWQKMLNRCRNPNYTQYADYGGRGINVCERWQEFENFYADMGEPMPNHTLDRYPNKDGNYEHSNCRWATNKEQHRNKRSNRPLRVNGESKLICEWVEIYGVPFTTITTRLDRGWHPFDAVSIPSQHFGYKNRHLLSSPIVVAEN